MKQKKLVSIIIPIYNSEEYLERCFESLVNQTYDNIEIIAINDGSTDNSLELCYKWEKLDSRIKVFSKKNGGISSARNYGITQSKGDYYSFIDSDDDVSYNFIELLVRNLEMNQVDVSMCGINKIYTYKNKIDNKSSRINNIKLDRDAFLEYIELENSYDSFVWNKLFKKDIVNNTMFEEDIFMNEDTIFMLKLCMQNPTFYYEDQKLYNYYLHNDSISRKKLDDKKITGITSFNKAIEICNSYFPKYKDKYLIKKIQLIIWFKSSTIEKKYIKLLKQELKKCHIYKNYYFNKNVPLKKKTIFFIKNIFSRAIYYKNQI